MKKWGSFWEGLRLFLLKEWDFASFFLVSPLFIPVYFKSFQPGKSSLVFIAHKILLFLQEKRKSFEHLFSLDCYCANFLCRRASYLARVCFNKSPMSVHRVLGYHFWRLWSLLDNEFSLRLFRVRAHMSWSLPSIILSLESCRKPFLKQFLGC